MEPLLPAQGGGNVGSFWSQFISSKKTPYLDDNFRNTREKQDRRGGIHGSGGKRRYHTSS